jgi:hypothetical protein
MSTSVQSRRIEGVQRVRRQLHGRRDRDAHADDALHAAARLGDQFVCGVGGEGERPGRPVVDVLLGDADPSGRLPFTWYGGLDQLPAIGDYSIRPNVVAVGRDGKIRTTGTGIATVTATAR